MYVNIAYYEKVAELKSRANHSPLLAYIYIYIFFFNKDMIKNSSNLSFKSDFLKIHSTWFIKNDYKRSATHQRYKVIRSLHEIKGKDSIVKLLT